MRGPPDSSARRLARRGLAPLWSVALLVGCGVAIASEQPPLPSPAQVLTVGVTLGDPEVVMDYSRDSCREGGGLDLPDIQARAMRRADGSLLLVSGNSTRNFSMVGRDFAHLRRDCRAVLTAGDDHAASSFDNQEWLLAVYREGTTVHGLIHNEYHDPVATNCAPGNTEPGNPCWYNAITYAVSTDDGHTFTQPPAPAHVVAALPYPWSPEAPRGAPPPHGYFTPSNILSGPDGYYYSMFMSIADRANPQQGQCVMRTQDLADPSSWRAWDGTGFDLPMPSPYDAQGNPAPTGRPACTPVSQRTIWGMGGSLTFNTYLKRYILVGNGTFDQVCGSWFALSEDLITWSTPQLLMPGKLPYGDCAGGSPNGSLIYPSLIDHDAPGDNFETAGQTPYLYYVRWNDGLDRDLERVPVRFERLEAGTPSATAPSRQTATATGRPVRATPTPTGRPIRATPTAIIANWQLLYLPAAVRSPR